MYVPCTEVASMQSENKHSVRMRGGFTLIEIVIAVAIVAIFAAALSPMVFKHLEDAKRTKAQEETHIIAMAILSLYKDTNHWPITNGNGPPGAVDRVLTSGNTATGEGVEASTDADNWGSFGSVKQLGDYLYYNNPDDNMGDVAENQTGQDYPINGHNAWRGPYIERYSVDDPWGHAYVVNARYFSSGKYVGKLRHKVFVLSAGPDGRWQTAFNDDVIEEIRGDDIGALVALH